MMICEYEGHRPQLGKGCFVAQNATVLGRVTFGEDVGIWYGTVLRGDVGSISVGDRTNIQDLTVVHVTTDRFDTFIGRDCTIGHGVILHGCVIQDRVLIGMGATVMDGANIGSYSLVAAGALVTPGTVVPEGSLVVGSPARVKRALKEEERQLIDWSAPHYVQLARKHEHLPINRER